MAKGNIRSMRFSDEVIEMIESQAGESFTAKFEALVTRCMWELPKKEQELKEIQERIKNEKKRLANIQKQVGGLDIHLWELNKQIQSYSTMMKQATSNLDKLINK